MKTCYMCNRLSSSREHVPPLCLFPETKDVYGLDFRKDLLTVPSCEEHNSKKSKDDEFLMVSVASILQNNPVGHQHARTKVDRALRRKSKYFLHKVVLRNPKSRILKTSNGINVAAIEGSPDYNRLIRCFEHIGFGMYYHQFGLQFKGELKIILGFLKYSDPNSQTMSDFITKKFELEDLALEIEGANPNVFTYQFCSPDEFGLVGLVLNFYGASKVFVVYRPKGIPMPKNLGVELISKGVKTVLPLDGKNYEFNK